jgi:glycosyltransferase involved in cell wall biosynthesis
MQIFHLNAYDKEGGAARAVYRLHHGLLESDVNSHMVVQRKQSDEQEILALNTRFHKFCFRMINVIAQSIFKLQKSVNYNHHSLNYFQATPFSWLKKVVNNADIVHLHWINAEMLKIENIKKINKPLLWTMHDMWPFCGAEHCVVNDCRRYSQSYTKANRNKSDRGLDIDRWVWKRKFKNFPNLKKIVVVCPSNWLASCVRESVLFMDKRVEVIHNGLDLDVYKPIAKHLARQILNLDEGKRYILFGAQTATGNVGKGYEYLKYAVNNYLRSSEKEIELLIFGSSCPKDNVFSKYKSHYLGTINDDITLALLYSAADVMVVPSVLDNLPNTAVEAVACACPVVAFNVGGLPDVIDHKVNGYLATPYEAEDLANGITWVLHDSEKYKILSQNARKKAEQKFDIKKIAEQYIKLYREII